MNYIFIFLLIFTVTLTSCATYSPDELLVMKITKIYEQREKKERDLTLVGRGSAMPDKIQEFILHFYSLQNLEKNQARKLIIDLAEDLITLVNGNEEIQKYLEIRPFNVNNCDLDINFRDINNMNRDPPRVALVSLKKGKISYFYYDNINSRYLFHMTTTESYQEALRIVGEEK